MTQKYIFIYVLNLPKLSNLLNSVKLVKSSLEKMKNEYKIDKN